jgi:sporulation protein YpjB
LSLLPYYEVVRGGIPVRNSKRLKNMIKVFVLALIFIFPNQSIGVADQSEHLLNDKHAKWQKLNELAEESLLFAKKQEFGASKKSLNELAAQFINIEIGDYVNRIEQAQILLDTIVQAKEALNPLQPNKEQVEQKILRMRLALDAVSHKKQPLWISYYPTMAKTINELMFTIENNERDRFYHLLNQLSGQFEMVRPAMIISHPPGVVEKTESQLSYMLSNKGELWKSKDQAMQMLKGFERQIKISFFQKVDNSLQAFLFIILGIGTLICSVLSYVAWRKYKGEKEKKTVSWKREKG